jgi:putative membrane protein
MPDRQNETKAGGGDPRDHLANERTLLAWIRTSIGIMAFGFVVVKFSMFIRQMAYLLDKKISIQQHGYSSFIGILLVLLGALTLLLGFYNYKRNERQISSGNYSVQPRPILTLVSLLFIIGILLIAYLIQNYFELDRRF